MLTKDKMKPFKKSLQGKTTKEIVSANTISFIDVFDPKRDNKKWLPLEDVKEAVEELLKDICVCTKYMKENRMVDDSCRNCRCIKKHFAGVLEK